jgi:ATP-binding protein involved in chromosome partitioning
VALSRAAIPDGEDLISADLVRAVQVNGGQVRFVTAAPSPEIAH